MILRQAECSELERLIQFYRTHSSQQLPAPSIRDLADTLDMGRLLVIESERKILAASAIFEFSPRNAAHYVGELSGTRVTGSLGGFGPVSVQRLLIAARVAGHAASEREPAAGCASSLVTIVKADNLRSIQNVTDAGFTRLSTKPDWFAYEELAWHGRIVVDEWLYYIACDATVRQSIRDLQAIGVLGQNRATLLRTDRATGREQREVIEINLPGLQLASRDLDAIEKGAKAGLSPPPAELPRR